MKDMAGTPTQCGGHEEELRKVPGNLSMSLQYFKRLQGTTCSNIKTMASTLQRMN